MSSSKKPATFSGRALDHDDFGLNQSKNHEPDRFLEERDAGGKPVSVFLILL
jgi:hypothetical protein